MKKSNKTNPESKVVTINCTASPSVYFDGKAKKLSVKVEEDKTKVYLNGISASILANELINTLCEYIDKDIIINLNNEPREYNGKMYDNYSLASIELV